MPLDLDPRAKDHSGGEERRWSLRSVAGGGLAGLGRNRPSGGGFTWGKAEENEGATGNASRGSGRDVEDRRAAYIGEAQHGGNGEQSGTHGSEREMGKCSAGFLTLTRNFGGGLWRRGAVERLVHSEPELERSSNGSAS